MAHMASMAPMVSRTRPAQWTPSPRDVPVAPTPQGYLNASLQRSDTINSLSTSASSVGAGVIQAQSQKPWVPHKNTFVHFPEDRTISLEGFYQERQVQSAPGSGVKDEEGNTVEAVTCAGGRTPSDVASPVTPYAHTNQGEWSVVVDPRLAQDVGMPQGASVHWDMIDPNGLSHPWNLSAAEPHSDTRMYARSSRWDGNPDAVEFHPGACEHFDESMLGSAEMPTKGSFNHNAGQCKPCAFAWKDGGCSNGVQCPFCHLCEAGEKERRQKEKKERQKEWRRARSMEQSAPQQMKQQGNQMLQKMRTSFRFGRSSA